MRPIYLLGVNHKYQLGFGGAIPVEGTLEEFAEFEQFVRRSFTTYDIRGVAEEMSPAALRKHFISGDSLPCRLAGGAGLAHRYCDPDPEARKRLSIESNDQRERHWIQEQHSSSHVTGNLHLRLHRPSNQSMKLIAGRFDD